MTALDIILLLCFIPAIWTGASKGLVHQIAGLIALLLGIWAAYKFAPGVGQWLSGWMEVSGTVLKICAYALIFLAVAFVVRIVGWLLEKVLQFALLGWANRLFGVVMAIFCTAVLLGVLIMLFNSLNVHLGFVKEEVLAGSGVYQFLKNFAYTVFPFMKQLLF